MLQARQCLPPGEVFAGDERVQQAFEERELLGILEDGLSNALAVGPPVLAEHALSQPFDQRGLHLRVGGEQVVDDLVARDGGGAVGAEGGQGGTLARTDRAGDGDRDRSGHALRGLLGLLGLFFRGQTLRV
jgi:hypothetical protein